MKKRIISLLCLGIAAVLSVSGAACADETEASEIVNSEVPEDGLREEDLTEGELLDMEEEDYFMDEAYNTESEKLVGIEMENPFGGNTEALVWEDIEAVPDTDGETYSTLSSYANNISIAHEILKSEDDMETLLKSAIKQTATENMSYVNIVVESPRYTADRAWVLMSFSGKGSTPYAAMITFTRIDEDSVLRSAANWYLGMDIYGIDYTPEDKYLTIVKDGFGFSAADGEEAALTEEDKAPELNLHQYEISDSRVGRKFFYVWEEYPYVMSAEDMSYDFSDFDFEEESFPEDIADEDDYDFDLSGFEDTESDEEWEDDDYLWDAEYSDSEEDWEWDESDLDWSGLDLDDSDYYEDEDDSFIAYCSTGARGVFVNAEMYVLSEGETIEDLMEEYISNLPYMGARSLMRSEPQTEGNASWISVQFGEEADDAYTDLLLIHAFVWDDTTYTKMDIYVPSDANEECLEELLAAYGLGRPEAEIEVEQLSVDYDVEEEPIEYGFDASSEEEPVELG